MASLSVLHILRTIKERGPISRTELQQVTGLSWGTITNTTRDLLGRNLIKEEGPVPTKAGRKPVCLTINPTSHSLIGFELASRVMRCIVLSLSGEALWYGQREYNLADKPEKVLEQATALIVEATKAPGVNKRQCLGVGLAAPGALDVSAGIIRFAPRLPGWNNVPIRDILQAKLGGTVLLEHDPDCLALAERWFGEAGAADDVLCINLGEGIGMGILQGGEIMRGVEGMAGEFGHITVDPHGPDCACGNNGCVEALCSISAIMEFIRSNPHLQSEPIKAILSQRTPTLHELVVAGRQKDEAVLGAFYRMGEYLGIGVANVINLFNPHMVVLCGPLTIGVEFFMPPMEQQIAKRAWRHSRHNTIISQLGQQAIAIGACGVVLQSLFAHDLPNGEPPAEEVEKDAAIGQC